MLMIQLPLFLTRNICNKLVLKRKPRILKPLRPLDVLLYRSNFCQRFNNALA